MKGSDQPISPCLPPVFDPQVNGYGGVDFQDPDLNRARLSGALAAWSRDGGDGFLVTLVTDSWDSLLRKITGLRRILTSDERLASKIPGLHIEGPFLSGEPGYHGAHDPSQMIDPSPDHMRRLRDAAGDSVLLVTLAPERRGSCEAIAVARSLGITISLGHTNATATQLREAASAGASGFTHLGNACPQQIDRHDNILWRAIETPGLVISLIPDRIHVSPPLFRLIHKVIPSDRIIYTTDAMAAAGAQPGEYSVGRLRLQVGADRIVRQPGRSNFAGSALQPGEILPNASEMLGQAAAQLAGSVGTGVRRWLNL